MSRSLLEAAKAAAANAHAPYSRFGVGAALLLKDGTVVTGCNFENASYGLTLCAETVALGTLNTQGRLRDVREIAVVGGQIGVDGIGGDAVCFPCGRCRQVINEAAQLARTDIPIHCASADLSRVETVHISTLLPHPFGPADLGLIQDD